MKTAAICLASALSVSSSQAVVYTLFGDLDPIQATTNSGNVGNGSGTISGSYDDATMLLDYSISFSDLEAPVTVMHFHVGAPGSTGGVDLGISDTTSPSTATGVILTEAQEANLLGGLWYVNIHTDDFPAGEIRGQVGTAAIPEPGTSLLLLGALGAMGIRRRRS